MPILVSLCWSCWMLQAETGLEGLCAEVAALMTNSAEGQSGQSQQVATSVSFTGLDADPVLVIVEGIRDAAAQSTLYDTHRIPVHAIENIRLYVDEKLPTAGPNTYLVIQYQSGKAEDAYAFEGTQTPVFGSVKAIRVGLYRPEGAQRAMALLDRIRASVQRPP